MTVGIDVGISTAKAAALQDGEPAGSCRVPVVAGDPLASASGALGRLLRDLDRPLEAVRRLAVTGVGAAALGEELFGLPCRRVDEFQATGCGALFLAGLDRAIVASMGTGTFLVRAGPDGVRHLGGSGVGGGTLQGLSAAILGTADVPALLEMASSGDLARVDLRVADLVLTPEGPGGLPASATASNLGRLDGRARPGDYALGILNLVFQAIGVLAALAARQEGLADVVLAGRLATIPQAREILAGVAGLHPVHFLFPPNPEQATALGAAFLA